MVYSFALIAYLARFVGYANLTDPTLTLPLELLHGATYGLGKAAEAHFIQIIVRLSNSNINPIVLF